MDQIDDVLKMEPTGEGQIDAVPACPCTVFPGCELFLSESGGPLAAAWRWTM